MRPPRGRCTRSSSPTPPAWTGWASGFYEQTINGERTIQHAGNLIRFHALLTLLPERDVGVFVAYNSYGEGGDFAEYELPDAFIDRYYPEEPPATLKPSAADAAENAERFAGSYRTTRANSTGFEKVVTLVDGREGDGQPGRQHNDHTAATSPADPDGDGAALDPGRPANASASSAPRTATSA